MPGVRQRPPGPNSLLAGLCPARDRMIRRGTFRSVQALERAIYQWLAAWNDNPKPFLWKATADVILDKVQRCKELNGTAH